MAVKKEEETIKEIEEIQEIEEIKESKTLPENNKKGMGISSMVLGICSIVFSFKFLIGLPCGILAIVFGVKGKKTAGRKMAEAGFITGIIGLSLQVVLFLLIWLFAFAFLGAISSAV